MRLLPRGMLAALLVATVQSSAFAATFEPVPDGCERLVEVLREIESATVPAHLGENRARALTSPVCRAAIDSGRWPALTTTLTSDSANGTPATREQLANRRAAYCAVAPLGAATNVARWLVARSTTGDDVGCTIMLLRNSPADFERVAAARFASTAQPADAGGLLGGLVTAMSPSERLKLLPTLQRSTAAKEVGRDWLYSQLCTDEPARSHSACRDFPAVLEPQPQKGPPWRLLSWHVASAFAYATALALAQRKWGRDAIPWAVSALGTVAILIVIGAGILKHDSTSSPLAGVFSDALMPLMVVPATAAGLIVGWAFVRLLRFPPAIVGVCQALFYAALIVDYGTRHW